MPVALCIFSKVKCFNPFAIENLIRHFTGSLFSIWEQLMCLILAQVGSNQLSTGSTFVQWWKFSTLDFCQRWIQDSPWRWGGGRQHTVLRNVSLQKNCIKSRNFWFLKYEDSPGAPPRSANVWSSTSLPQYYAQIGETLRYAIRKRCDAPVRFCFMQHRKKVNTLGNKAFQPKFLALLEIHEVESTSLFMKWGFRTTLEVHFAIIKQFSRRA